ncbi:hypothetical protein [Paraburkholderia sp. J69-1]|uniref:hypothetical protein n=1 Tax=Paraburkholderia sp. J69-1 TaxID=2805436 RepID=UPI002AB6E385|nr:hypothetical protein [Paraburkholderia sp. J69-1]
MLSLFENPVISAQERSRCSASAASPLQQVALFCPSGRMNNHAMKFIIVNKRCLASDQK